MSVAHGYGKTTTNGAVLWIDTGELTNCYLGPVTSNVYGNSDLTIYNNTPSNLDVTLTRTSDTFKGFQVWKEVISAKDATGLSYLQNANNPGLGVYLGTTSFPANTYVGCSIYFKPPPDSTYWANPIINYYSNMSGWSVGSYNYVGNGWYRAYNNWFSGSTANDGKFWAINLQAAAVGVPYTVYWAGNFREDQNRIDWVSRPTLTQRSITSSLYSLVGNHQIDMISASYNANEELIFSGSSNFIRIPNNTTLDSQTITMESVFYPTINFFQNGFLFEKGTVNTQYSMFLNSTNLFYFRTIGLSNQDLTIASSTYFTLNRWNHVVCTCENGNKRIYVNGVIVVGSGGTGTISTNDGGMSIGAYGGYSSSMAARSYFLNGKIAVTKVYNRALTQDEITLNYNHYKSRYNLP